jgi:multiple sugar transport system substrate-binding protein
MKKQSLLLVLPSLLAVSLVSCGGTPTSSAAAASSAAASSTVAASSSAAAASSSETPASTSSAVATGPFITTPTTITLWSITGQNNQAQLDNYVKGFLKTEPNVKINNVIQTGMGYNDLKDAVEKGFSTADGYPDMVQCYPDHVAEYLDYGKAVKLDSYMDNADYGLTAEDKADYVQAFMQEGQQYAVSGTYSLPYCKSTELMFYNKDVLNAQLDLSAFDSTLKAGTITQNYLDNLTWDELFNHLAPALKAYNDTLAADKKIISGDSTANPTGGYDKKGNKYSAVFAYDSDDNLFITLAEQYGYGYTSVDAKTGKGSIDFNNTDMQGLMQKFNAAAQAGYFMTKGSAGNNYTNTYFTNGGSLFSVGSTGGVKYQFTTNFNVGVARIPQASATNRKVINQGPSLVVLDHSDENRKLASWLFYKYMTNKANSLDWAINSGYMGIRQSNYVDENYIEAMDATTKDDKTIEKLMALSGTKTQEILSEMYTSPAFKGSSAARTAASAIMTWSLQQTSWDATAVAAKFKEQYDAVILKM